MKLSDLDKDGGRLVPELFKRETERLGLVPEPERCRKCGHVYDDHRVVPDGYHCKSCRCKRRFLS